jgi:hypothetical protein
MDARIQENGSVSRKSGTKYSIININGGHLTLTVHDRDASGVGFIVTSFEYTAHSDVSRLLLLKTNTPQNFKLGTTA